MPTALSPLTTAEVRALAAASPTCDLPVAGRAFGLGVNRSYELAAAGEFPCQVLRLGRKYRVPTAGLLAALGLAGSDPADGPSAA